MDPAPAADEQVQDPTEDQIDYSREEPWIREKFEGELAARSIKSDMPEDAYRIRDYEWKYDA